MKNVRCYCCQKFDHYPRGGYFNKKSNGNDKEEAQFSHEKNSDFQEVILITNTHLGQDQSNVCYLDTNCNNDMTDNNDWFIKLNKSVRMSIGSSDNNIVTFEGIGNTVLKRNDG